MASKASCLLQKLQDQGLHPVIYSDIFHCHIDLEATVHLHSDAFEEILQYMEDHVKQYAVQFLDSHTTWVPLDYIKYIYGGDKNLVKRLKRFVTGLTSKQFCEIDDTTMVDLGYGNTGTEFLSWDMTICFFLQEGKASDPRKKGKEKMEDAALVQEKDKENEEIMTEAEEASMALCLFQFEAKPDEDEGTLEGDEVLQSVPEFDVRLLLPVVINGCEFLFLDDVCKCMGLREDEALSALAQIAAVEEEPQGSEAQPPRTKLDLTPDPIRQDIQLITGSAMGTLEESVAHALLAIKGVEEEYSSVPESAFQPHQALHVSGARDFGGSINISAAHVVETDDQTSNAIQIDAFATRKGGIREQSSGRDSSLWHYLPCFNAQVLRVVHLEYDEEAIGELAVCKALSTSLCDEPLAQNANKCILVSREAAVYTFAGKFEGHVLSRCALSLSRGVEEHKSIVDTIGQEVVLDDARKEAMRALLRNM